MLLKVILALKSDQLMAAMEKNTSRVSS